MSSNLSEEVITQIFQLARLIPENNETGHNMQVELNNILKMVSQIETMDTQNIAPMAHPLNMPQPFRKDEVTESNERNKLLPLAPQSEAGFFLVPLVIE